MKKITHNFHKSHDIKTMKFSVTALAALCSVQALSADWTELSTNIENGSLTQKFHYYTGEGKQAELYQANIQKHALTGNIIGAISDNNLNKNADINGFTLTLKDTPLTKKRTIFAAGSHSGSVTQNTLILIMLPKATIWMSAVGILIKAAQKEIALILPIQPLTQL